MPTLPELSAREAEIAAVVERAVGLMEEKAASLAAAGVFRSYADVLAGYVALLRHPEAGLEALKRAAFLVWYEVAEPACFSGLRDLPEPLVRATLAELDSAAVSARLDAELAAMLGYYHSIADFAFTRGGPWPALDRLLNASDRHAWRTQVPPPEHRWSRGRLSDYWTSISPVT